MASMRLSVLLQPEDDLGEAQLQLVSLLATMRASSISISPDAQQKWDKPYFKRTLDSWNEFHTPEILDRWQKNEYPSIERGKKNLQNKLICLIKVGFGSKVAWILANFPNLGWYCHDKRKRAGAGLVVALLEWAEDAQAADPTTNLTVSRSCQTEHLPLTPAAVEERPDRNASGATTDTHNKLHDIYPFTKAATHGKTNEAGVEVQAYPESQIPRNTSPSRKHSGDDFISTKRVCRGFGNQMDLDAQDHPVATRETVSMDVIGASGNKMTATVTGTLSSSETEKGLMPVQGDGLANANILSKLLSSSAPSTTRIYPCGAYEAIDFLMDDSNRNSVKIYSDTFYTYYEIPSKNLWNFIDLESVPLDMKAQTPAVGEQRCTRGTERVAVGIPLQPTHRAFIVYTSHYLESNSHSQSFVQ